MDRPGLDGVERTVTTAERCLVRERRQVADELEAFRSFERRVSQLSPAVPATDEPPATAPVVTDASTAGPPSADGTLAATRDAYRATVMSVPHYEETYGDTYERSVAAELGADVGAALTEGVAFTGRCKAAALSAARACQRDRRQFLDLLDDEHVSLEAAAETLVPVATQVRSLDEVDVDGEQPAALDAYQARLAVLADRCEDLVAERQAAIDDQRRAFRAATDAPDVPAYLYAEMDATYPVLAAAADVAEVVRWLQRHVGRALDRDGHRYGDGAETDGSTARRRRGH